MTRKRNTDLLDGTLFVDQNINGILVLRYWTLRISVFYANGIFKLLECGKNYLLTNTYGSNALTSPSETY
jgi:hypothetical protein